MALCFKLPLLLYFFIFLKAVESFSSSKECFSALQKGFPASRAVSSGFKFQRDHLGALRQNLVADPILLSEAMGTLSLAVVVAQKNIESRNSFQQLPKEYDIRRIEDFYKSRPEKVVARAISVGSKVALIAAVLLPTLLLFRDDSENAKAARLKALSFMTDNIFGLGPAFIKFGQTLAARPDLIGFEAADQLTKLQDSLPFFPNEVARAKIKAEMGKEINEIFENFSPAPVAAASLGQVYKAELAGRAVAVKVQRPQLTETMAMDSLLVRTAAKSIMDLSKALNAEIKSNLTQAVDEFSCRLFEELDYGKEANNMVRFKELYGRVEGIYIPEVFSNCSTREVIVTEWINGCKIVGEGSNETAVNMELLQLGIQCTLEQLLDQGFLHADPHGGNLLRTPENKLAYLDFGLVSEIPPIVMDSLVIALIYLINRDYKSLANMMPGLMLLSPEDTERDCDSLALALAETFEPLFEEAALQGELFPRLAFSKLVDKLFGIAQSFSFVVPPYFLSNVRALAELEGMAMSTDPSFNLLGVIYPFVVKRLLTAPSRALKKALDNLIITPEGKVNWDVLGKLIKATNIPTSRTVPKDDDAKIMQYCLSEEGCRLKMNILEKVAIKFRDSITRKMTSSWENKDFHLPKVYISVQKMHKKWKTLILPIFKLFWKVIWVESSSFEERKQILQMLANDTSFVICTIFKKKIQKDQDVSNKIKNSV